MQNELYHYGIVGMKWGVRRYQNKDGSLTSAGKKRYVGKPEKKGTSDNHKTAIKVGAAIAGTALATYGAYRYSNYIKTTAGKTIVEIGNREAAELMKKVGEYNVRAAAFGGTSIGMHNKILWGGKATEAQNQAAKLLADTVDYANDVSKSFAKSYRYLHSKKR